MASWELDKKGEFCENFSGENGFLRWSWSKYNLGEQPSTQLTHYLDFANGDEKVALKLFFDDLEDFNNQRNTKSN